MVCFVKQTDKPFHVLLREFRASKFLSQEKFCKEYNIKTLSTYKRWEAANSGPSLPEHVSLIIDFLNYLSCTYGNEKAGS
jgi:DNA-binding transcriptional regulator YiaG